MKKLRNLIIVLIALYTANALYEVFKYATFSTLELVCWFVLIPLGLVLMRWDNRRDYEEDV